MPWRTFRRDGVACHPHAFVANALPLVLDSRLVPPLVSLSWQPFAVGTCAGGSGVFGPVDIVQFEFCATPGWMERVGRSTPTVYAAHNVEYDFARARMRRSIVRGAMLGRLAALERRAVRSSALVVTCTAGDAERMRELYGGDARVRGDPQWLRRGAADPRSRVARASAPAPPSASPLIRWRSCSSAAPPSTTATPPVSSKRELETPSRRLGTRSVIAGQCTRARPPGNGWVPCAASDSSRT